MKIRDCKWTPRVNILVIECDCGQRLGHRADSWWVVCPQCFRRENLQTLRDNIKPGDLKD